MSSDRIKVVGYAQKTSYNDQIEYRNFSPDLVGVQLASNGGTPLFTMGNFAVTTNFDPKKDKRFVTSNFSNFVTLTDLDLTLENAVNLLKNNDGVFLNLDKSNLSYYSLFGSLKEFTRVSLENIITNWPAALYINPIYALPPIYITQSGYTFENYTYDSLTNESIFVVNTNVITNKFDINFINISVDAQTNNLRNLNLNYLSYAIMVNNIEYNLLGFTGATNTTNDYVYFRVKGDVFSGVSNGYLTYYVKPNSIKENTFYNSLPDFEAYLLNRLSTPKFTSTFSFTEKSDGGGILHLKETLTWPTTDGYNIDFDTDEYDLFATKLLDITTNHDLTTSNLMVRFLVTESITDFDTTAVHLNPIDQDTSDQKMNKTLCIYGAEYDVINEFISGIQFANVVSYNKVNNVPDIYLKDLARVLGWDLISSVLENNLLKSYIQPSTSTYQGYSVGLTAIEADIELWRRLILNSPWLWKSKGTRKGVEFLFKFIGTPLGLIKFNEYIYLAENKIDIDLFQSVLSLNGLPTDIISYPIGSDGYPLPKPNTPEMYFQNNGLWYRQTGGDESSIDITSGNNPHVGPYDGGYKYINQFRELIPNFSAVTVSSSTSTIETKNIFTNYNLGSFTKYSGATYVDITTEDGIDFSDCFVVSATTIEDPKHRQDQTDCGCDIPENLRSLSVCIEKTTAPPYDCQKEIANSTLTDLYNYYTYNLYQYLPNGSIYTVNGSPVYNNTQFINIECCNSKNLTPYYYEQYIGDGITQQFEFQNAGYICCKSSQNNCGCYVTCKWRLAIPRWITFDGANYLQFQKEDGTKKLTSQDGCHCIANYTIPVYISASTTDIGYACQLTQIGQNDVDLSDSVIYKTYEKRSSGEIGCLDIYTPPAKAKIFGVVINNDNQIGKHVNSITFSDITTANIGGDFANVIYPLSGTPNSIVSDGYFYGFYPMTSPLANDTIRIQVAKLPMSYTLNGIQYTADITFNPNLGHRMYYMVSDVEYDNTTFLSNVFNQLNQLNVTLGTFNSREYYFADFTYTPTSNPVFIYLIMDISQEQPISGKCYKIQNETYLPGIYSYIDLNGDTQQGYLNPTNSVFKCSRNLPTGTNVTITGGDVPCTVDNQCGGVVVYLAYIGVSDKIDVACSNAYGQNIVGIYTTTPRIPSEPFNLVDGETYYESDGTPSQIGLQYRWVSDGCNYGKIDGNGVFTLEGNCPNPNC